MDEKISIELALQLCHWFWNEKQKPTLRKVKELIIVHKSKMQ